MSYISFYTYSEGNLIKEEGYSYTTTEAKGYLYGAVFYEYTNSNGKVVGVINLYFSLIKNNRLKNNIENYKKEYPEILEVCGEMKIVVDDSIFFIEPDFPVLEFLMFAEEWVNNEHKSNPMLYNSIKTEDNPLISFVNRKRLWLIKSPWQLFKSKSLFTKEEIAQALNELKQQVKMQLRG